MDFSDTIRNNWNDTENTIFKSTINSDGKTMITIDTESTFAGEELSPMPFGGNSGQGMFIPTMSSPPDSNRRERYKMGDRPEFEDGDIVEVDTYYFGVEEETAEYVEGVIVGKHELTFGEPEWIVDFGDKEWIKNDKCNAKYRAMIVSSCAICKKDVKFDL